MEKNLKVVVKNNGVPNTVNILDVIVKNFPECEMTDKDREVLNKFNINAETNTLEVTGNFHANNLMTLPAEAPESDALVGIGTNGAQKTIGVGSGLKVENNVLKYVGSDNVVEITFTEDDWDDEESVYVKRVDLNNTFVKVNFLSTPVPVNYFIYCENFKLCIPKGEFPSTFVGIENQPEERCLIFYVQDVQYEYFYINNGQIIFSYYEI